jgi:hypothetical protein
LSETTLPIFVLDKTDAVSANLILVTLSFIDLPHDLSSEMILGISFSI